MGRRKASRPAQTRRPTRAPPSIGLTSLSIGLTRASIGLTSASICVNRCDQCFDRADQCLEQVEYDAPDGLVKRVAPKEGLDIPPEVTKQTYKGQALARSTVVSPRMARSRRICARSPPPIAACRTHTAAPACIVPLALDLIPDRTRSPRSPHHDVRHDTAPRIAPRRATSHRTAHRRTGAFRRRPGRTSTWSRWSDPALRCAASAWPPT